MIRLKPVRRSRRAQGPPYRRRNPELAGTPVEDVAALVAGAYLTRQVSGFAARFLTPLADAADKVRTGLGNAVLSGASAVAVGMVGRKWRRHYGNMAQAGGLAIAGSELVTAFMPGADLLAGAPRLGGLGAAPRPALPAGGNGGSQPSSPPALPSVASQL